MIDGWNHAGSDNQSAPMFQSGSSNCDVTVKAAPIQSDGTIDPEPQPGMTSGSIIINSTAAGSWSGPVSNATLAHELGHLLGFADATGADGCSQLDTIMFSPINAAEPAACTPTPDDAKTESQQYTAPSGGGEDIYEWVPYGNCWALVLVTDYYYWAGDHYEYWYSESELLDVNCY